MFIFDSDYASLEIKKVWLSSLNKYDASQNCSLVASEWKLFWFEAFIFKTAGVRSKETWVFPFVSLCGGAFVM